ncbi:MAG: MATE family efflux transporter [Eubacteriales bacterium]
MTETPVSKLIFTLGIPTTVSMLITNIYNMADTYFVGTLGESPQAATGILFTLQAIIQAIAFMLGHGSGTYVSKALADKDTKEATRYVSTAFFTGAAAGTLLTIFGLIFLTPFMRLLGSTETILPYAKDYGFWVLISCPFMVCSLILNNNLRYEGKAFYAMIGLSAGGILNIFGDYILINMFNLGVWGAGLSTAISQIISFFLLLILYLRAAQSTVSLKAFSFDGTVHLNILKGGFPSLIRQGLSSVSNGLLNNFMKPYGDAAIAAMSVVNRYSSLVMCVGLGIGQGFQPVASFNYQAKQYDRVKKGLIFTMGMGFCFEGLLAGAGFVFARQIISFFQNMPEVIAIGVPALRIASGCLVFQAFFVPVNMLYQSIRKSGIASFLALLRSGAVFIPVLIIASAAAGLNGIIAAQPISDVLTAIISIPFIIMFMKKTPSTAEAKGELS